VLGKQRMLKYMLDFLIIWYW